MSLFNWFKSKIPSVSKSITLDDKLRAEYQELFDSARIIKFLNEVEKKKLKIRSQQLEYSRISVETNVPWTVIACIHSLEASLDLTKHLHCGDPLTARTVNEPKGCPKTGNPPFTFFESAVDALRRKQSLIDKFKATWTIPEQLFFMEAFNGFGYRLNHPTVKSPYLWSGTNIYKSGKYVSDGKWDGVAVSKQVGAVAILKSIS